eukprot:scaffold437_cov159-Amphora_coffeaeformis.AAC.13
MPVERERLNGNHSPSFCPASGYAADCANHGDRTNRWKNKEHESDEVDASETTCLPFPFLVIVLYIHSPTIPVKTMAEGGDLDRYQPRDRRDYYDPREDHQHYSRDTNSRSDRQNGGGRGYMMNDRGRGGGGGRGYMNDDRRGGGGGRGYMNDDRGGGRGGRGYMNDRRGGYRGGGGPPQRRAEDRFHMLRMAASQLDWKGDPVEYSKEAGENDNNNPRPTEAQDKGIRNCLRLLWSASPEPPTTEKQVSKKKRNKREGSESEDSSSDSESSSSSSSSEESRRRRRRRKKTSSSSRRKRKDDGRKKRSKRRRYSSSSSSRSSSNSDNESDASNSSESNSQSPRRGKGVDSEERPAMHDSDGQGAEIPVAAAAAHRDSDDSDDSSVGPQPAPVDADGNAANLALGGAGRANYGKALLPGEGSAMAQFVQNNLRVPRRGEIGYGADQIDKFENSGYVMSGSRHARMNAVRIRKENQVYTAEEQRALAMITLEEKAEKEKALVQDFRSMLEQKLQNKDAGKDG